MSSWLGQRDALLPSPGGANLSLTTLLPACALDCVPAACPLSDLACYCRTGYYGMDEWRDRCIRNACGYPELLPIQNRTATACGAPQRDGSTTFKTVEAVLFVLTSVLVASRLVFKQFFSPQRRLATDDWLIVLTSLVGVPCIGILLAGLNTHGLGRDAWAMPPGDVASFLFYLYILEVLYPLIVSLIRLTFTFFYLEIFSGRGTRILLWVTVVFHVVSGVAFVIKAIFQCLPVEHNWTRYDYVVDRTLDGKCVMVYISMWVNGALGVAADLWLLAIPLFQLKRMNLHWKKKVGATLMFMAGTIGTIISILRLRSIVYFGHVTNPTWDYSSLVYFSVLEVHVGMMCTCLPALRLILVRMWPRIFGVGPQQRAKTSPGRAGRLYSSHGALESITSEESCPSGLDKANEAAFFGAQGSHLDARGGELGASKEQGQ